VSKRLRAFDRLVPLRGGRLLDVGCGNGAYTIELARLFQDIDAIDIEPGRLGELVSHLAGRPPAGHVEVQLMSAEALEFPDDSFDAITAIEVLEHVADLSKAAHELARVLKPGGYLYVSVPNRLFPLETHAIVLPGRRGEVQGRVLPLLPYIAPLHRRISTARNFTAGGLTRLLADAGLERTGLDYVMPPFDNWRFGRRWIKPMTELIERSPLRVLGVSIIGVFRKTKSVRATHGA
jgi:SAM-dependent methyltransferase